MYNEKNMITSIPLPIEDNTTDGILKQARERAVEASIYWKDTYDTAREDTAFAYGDQWDQKSLENRKGRPTLTLNKLSQFIYRLVGDDRQNVQTIKTIPTGTFNGSVANTEGTKDYKMSELLEGIVQNIELNSNAIYHYKTAFQHSVEGGFGWLRVLTDYSSTDTFDLDLKISSVRHRWSVVIDPDAMEPDCSDMNYAFISERITDDEFRRRYPNKAKGTLQMPTQEELGFWGNDKTITVSEYFVREPIKRDLVMMSNNETYWLDEVTPVIDELAKKGITIVKKRKVNTFKVQWYKISAGDILEGPIDWCGTTIPIVPVWGKEINLNGKRSFRGLIHDAKDAQRMHNYWMSAATERVALAPKAPWVGAVKNFEGHENIWNTANITNWSYLPYNPTPNGDRPMRQDPPPMPAQELQIANQSEQGIKSSIGIYDANLGNRSQETSGIAIQARQQQGDTGTFIFQDNKSLAIERVGKILIEAIPIVYDSNRIVRMHFADGSGDFVEINKTIMDEQTKTPVVIHDLSMGKYDVSVTTGPQYLSQRQEAANSMLELVKVIPQIGQVAPDIIASNIDAPNMDIVADRLKRMLPPQMLSAEDRKKMDSENPPQPPPPPDPKVIEAQQQHQFDMQMQQMKIQEAQIKLEVSKVQGDTQMIASAQKVGQAQPMGQQDNQNTQGMIQNEVARAMAELIMHQRSQQAQQEQHPAQQSPQQQSPQEEQSEPTDNAQEEGMEN